MNLEQPTPKKIKVFISYSHAPEPHKQHVLKLANHLRSEGIDAVIDQYQESSPPPEGWQKWMDQQIDKSDFVIVVCTETYFRRIECSKDDNVRKDDKDVKKGQGVKWETALLYLDIYNNDSLNKRFIPVLLEGGDETYILRPLRSTTYYRYPEQYDALYRRLTGQPQVNIPEVGELRYLPPDDMP